MMGVSFIDERLSLIERCVDELRRFSSPERIETSIRERRFVERELQLAIQAMLEVASHLTSVEHDPTRAADPGLIFSLIQQGAVDPYLGGSLVQGATFCRPLGRPYPDLAPSVLRTVLERHLDEIGEFVISIRDYVGRCS
jgi:uncharacterized protein YutE (UPF0331/DUF86 family)